MAVSRIAAMVIVAGMLLFACSCRKTEESDTHMQPGRLKVVTTLFPVYDFSRAIAGGHADVMLLLPPAMEPHSFEPRPADMATLAKADIFIYTNPAMEPWAERILQSQERGGLVVVNAGKGAAIRGADPHIWLDFANALIMIDTIAEAFSEKDGRKRDVYRENAETYKRRLNTLDQRYRDALSGCRKRVLINGGHFTFGYLAERYGLTYKAAYGFSPDAEPTARALADLSNMVKEQKLSYIFSEELLAPRVAETIARETGASILKLHGGHNISREEFAAGTTFIDLMEKNLEHLEKGLECR